MIEYNKIYIDGEWGASGLVEYTEEKAILTGG